MNTPAPKSTVVTTEVVTPAATTAVNPLNVNPLNTTHDTVDVPTVVTEDISPAKGAEVTGGNTSKMVNPGPAATLDGPVLSGRTGAVNPLDNPAVFVNPDVREQYRKQRDGRVRVAVQTQAVVQEPAPGAIVNPDLAGTGSGAKTAPRPAGPMSSPFGPGTR